MTMTPSEIEFILFCHYSHDRHPRLGSPAIQDHIGRFIKEGLIESFGDDFYKTTTRGDAYIAALLAVPLPEQAWTVNGKVYKP